jgi:peptidoglycan hydrolase CwlO-like protein
LALLQRKLELREQAIRNIGQQINAINTEMHQSGTEVIRLSQELDTLKQQYERGILATYKNRSSYDMLNFIFSAASFNDALIRISYLKSYHADREQRKADILQRQQLLNQRLAN